MKPPIRRIQTIERNNRTIHWPEMDHPGESSTDFAQLWDNITVKNRWAEIIKPGMCCIDIGTHSGDTTVVMAALSQGTVLAIEPNPTIMPYMQMTAELNEGLADFVLCDHAVTTAPGTITILDHCNRLCNGGMIDPTWTPELKQRMLGMAGQQVTVPADTLTNIVEQHLNNAKVDFIKIDTEGHDVSIIDSSRDLIARDQPVIFMEWFFAYGPTEVARMFDVISSIGYQAFDPETMQPASAENRIPDLLLLPLNKV